MVNRKRWQVPGNGNPFDSKLEDWLCDNSIMSQRSIGVLEFINIMVLLCLEAFFNTLKPNE